MARRSCPPEWQSQAGNQSAYPPANQFGQEVKKGSFFNVKGNLKKLSRTCPHKAELSSVKMGGRRFYSNNNIIRGKYKWKSH
jgi:hypothetical protein